MLCLSQAFWLVLKHLQIRLSITPSTMSRYRTVGARSRKLLVYEGNFCVMSSTWLLDWLFFLLTSKQLYEPEQHGTVQFNHVTFISFYILLCTGPRHRRRCIRFHMHIWSTSLYCKTLYFRETKFLRIGGQSQFASTWFLRICDGSKFLASTSADSRICMKKKCPQKFSVLQ